MRNAIAFKVAAAVAAAVFWAMPAAAQQVTCLNDSERKVCLQLTAQPDTVVQASRLGGGDTYVHYRAVLTGLKLPSSSRNVEVSFTLTPAVDIVDFQASGSGTCTVDGARLSCLYDKLDAADSATILLTARAPDFAGPSTSPTLLNTGEFGWNGRTATASKSLAVSTAGGHSWVPPNTTVTLVTAPEQPDPAHQTTPEDPLFAKMIIPGRPIGFEAYLAINPDTAEDFSLSCSGGLFFSGNSDGGPYVCRDIGPPHDAGNPRRWVEAAIDSSVDGTFTDEPVQVIVIWDDSIVPPTQLSPTPAAPNGTPPLAVFYRADEAGDPIRAFAKPCDANAPPCLSAVANYATGDWSANLNVSELNNDGAEADPLVPAPVLGALSAVLDRLLQIARAGVLDDKVIIR